MTRKEPYPEPIGCKDNIFFSIQNFRNREFYASSPLSQPVNIRYLISIQIFIHRNPYPVFSFVTFRHHRLRHTEEAQFARSAILQKQEFNRLKKAKLICRYTVEKEKLIMKYRKRIADEQLKLRLEAFGTVQIKGSKWCGENNYCRDAGPECNQVTSLPGQILYELSRFCVATNLKNGSSQS